MSARHAVIMAGGTGGHVFPGLAVAEVLCQRGWTVSWLGTDSGLEARLVPARGIELDCITVRALRGKGLPGWLLMPVRLLRAVRQARRVFLRRRPAVVLGMGGFASGPGGLAAWLMRLPLVIHEQNAIAGLTNRVLARFAARVLSGFPGSFPEAVAAQTVGNPVRRTVIELPAPDQRLAERRGPIRLLIVGGSQGARALNDHLPAAVVGLPRGRVEVWHQCGPRWVEDSRARWQAAGVDARVEAFIEDMAAAWSWADLAICRAGALTVAELAAAGVASVLVPFPAAVDDHQTANALFLERLGAARLLPQERLESGELGGMLEQLTEDRDRLRTMGSAARSAARPDADQVVADACESLLVTPVGGVEHE